MKYRLKITEIRYKNINKHNNNFYHIIIAQDLKTNELVTIKGESLYLLQENDIIYINGTKTEKEYNNEKYYEIELNKDTLIGKSYQSTFEGFKKFLTGLPSIGDKTADKIIELYTNNDNNITDIKHEFITNIEKINNKELLKILNEKKIEKIKEYFKNEKKLLSSLNEFKLEFNIPNHVIKKLENFGLDVIETFLKDPYTISFKIKGIGFKTVDKIALTIQKRLQNNDNFDFLRLKAAIFYSLKEAEKDGHVYLGIPGIKYYLQNNLKISDKNISKDLIKNKTFDTLIDEILNELDLQGYIKLQTFIRKDKEYKVAYLIENYNMEIYIAEEINKRLNNNDNIINIDKIHVDKFITLSDKQDEAIRKSLKENLFIVTGGPGTGKTTVAKYIFKNLKYYFPNKSIHIMAPTGTAAKRIGNVIGTEATTIHIGLKWKKGNFQYNEYNKLPADIIMIDEASMIDMPLFYNLLKALKEDAKVILIGDIDQLPPVGIGKILEDLLKSNIVPFTKLDRIYRQNEGNPIADFAYEVNNSIVNFFTYTTREYRKNKKMNIIMKKSFNKKENEKYQQNMEDEIIDVFYENFKNMDIMDIQILAQMKVNKGGVNSINKRIQELVNENKFIPGTYFKIGDKVLQIKNNYEKEVMNGNIGKIIGFDDNKVQIEFIEGTISKIIEYSIKSSDDNDNISKNLELGYCMTIHKSQGNEWKKVFILFNNYFFINKKIIYTGVTRAREQAVIVSNYPILTHGIKTEFGIKEINGKLVKITRNTNLQNFLKKGKKCLTS